MGSSNSLPRKLRSNVWIQLALLMGTYTLPAAALVHFPGTDWPNVQEYRNRNNISYGYETKHINAEACRFLNETECEYYDGLYDPARRHLQVSSPSTGTDIIVPVLLLRFSDHRNRELPDKAYFENLFNGPEGVAEYFFYNSLGTYQIKFEIYDWHQLFFRESHYADSRAGQVGADQLQELGHDALDDIYDPDVFARYDSNGDDVLDHLVLIHSGYDSAFGKPTDDCTNQQLDRIWSQGVAITARGWTSSDGQYRASTFMVAGSFDPPLCDGAFTSIGVIVHEFMHGFRLIDLYDQDADDPRIFIGGTGRFCLMSSLFGWNRNLAIPGHLNSYSRLKANWIEPIELTVDGTYPLQALEYSNQAYIIRQGFDANEYLLIENRQPVKFDRDWPAGGIVIYHVDENINGQGSRGYPDHRRWPREHYEVAVLQADGRHGIETGQSPGDEGDFWRNGMTLGSGGAFPNTDSYASGELRPTGIEITVTSDSQFIMSFQVKGLSGSSALAFPVDPRFSDDVQRPAPSTVGGSMRWILSTIAGLLTMVGILGFALQHP